MNTDCVCMTGLIQFTASYILHLCSTRMIFLRKVLCFVNIEYQVENQNRSDLHFYCYGEASLGLVTVKRFLFESRLGCFCVQFGNFPLHVWVVSEYSSFFLPYKNMHVRLVGDSNLVPSVSVHGCLSLLLL